MTEAQVGLKTTSLPPAPLETHSSCGTELLGETEPQRVQFRALGHKFWQGTIQSKRLRQRHRHRQKGGPKDMREE